MKPATKDPKVLKRRAGADFAALFAGLKDPATLQARMEETTGTAEGALLRLAFLGFQELVTGEGPVGQLLRELAAAICNPQDPLRRAMKQEHWAVLWPPLNALLTAREDLTRGREEARRQAEEARRAEAASPAAPGAGVLWPDSRAGGGEGEVR